MPIEFDCEGCGAHVYGVGRDTMPPSRMCATCEWMCEFLPDPDEFWAVYSRSRDIDRDTRGGI